MLPTLITASMPLPFLPKGGKWWDYLDPFESAHETNETIDLSVLPALQVHTRIFEKHKHRPAAG